MFGELEHLKIETRFGVYYESIKRKLKTKYIWGCRCYERLQPNTKEFTRLIIDYFYLIDDNFARVHIFFFRRKKITVSRYSAVVKSSSFTLSVCIRTSGHRDASGKRGTG